MESTVTRIEDSPAHHRTVKASEFKAKCLALMDEVADGSGDIVITKYGRPVARLTTCQERPKTLFGADRGRMKITGDIISPMDVEWDAISNPDRVIDP